MSIADDGRMTSVLALREGIAETEASRGSAAAANWSAAVEDSEGKWDVARGGTSGEEVGHENQVRFRARLARKILSQVAGDVYLAWRIGTPPMMCRSMLTSQWVSPSPLHFSDTSEGDSPH